MAKFSFTVFNVPNATIEGEEINSSGEVAGFYHDGNNTYHGFIYNGVLTTFNDPAGLNDTTVSGINDSGQVVGDYSPSGGGEYGFIYNNGIFHNFSDPGTGSNGSTYVAGINKFGEIAGDYTDSQGNYHGFTYSGGTFTSFTDPSSVFTIPGTSVSSSDTQVTAINASAAIAGSYSTSFDFGFVEHGFIYRNGVFTNLDDPGAGSDPKGGTISVGTLPVEISASGEVAGTYWDSNGTPHGFIYNNRVFTNFSDPAAGGVNTLGTYVAGINASGVVAGTYYDSSGVSHGFTYSNGVFTNFDAPNASSLFGTTVWGINDAGQVVGSYEDGNDLQHGFIATPTTTGALGQTNADFYGTGYSDLIWQNTDGQAVIWEQNGTTAFGGGPAGPDPGLGWNLIGTGDFNGDGLSDFLWQNTNGQADIWEMDGTNKIGGGTVGPNPGPNWDVIGSGDFNHDGNSDILWQNTTTGQAVIWEMNGTNVIGGGPVSQNGAALNAGPSWKAIGTGDFNGDGYSDILWQNTVTGQAAIWEMNGTNVLGNGAGGLVSQNGMALNAGPSWTAIGTGDFNGDGHSDILWQNTVTGQAAIWEMNGNNVIGGGPVSQNGVALNAGPSWKAIGTGDYFGDGHTDILWQNTNGQAAIWDMNGNNVIGGGPVALNPGTSWHAIA
ncbi:FG-GAP-like repeat-containing protein [Bradyrhizobium sp. STM 3562]|uniref:FG-GAP-like repeat-containing protein n=1 Tax=Bradyrhizobium sp. STM 3562 TaxID=578924 RepID=UPI00388FEF6C